jgi:hypothetical protein
MARVTITFEDQPDGNLMISSDSALEELAQREASRSITLAEGAALTAFRGVIGAIRARSDELMAQKDAAIVH